MLQREVSHSCAPKENEIQLPNELGQETIVIIC